MENIEKYECGCLICNKDKIKYGILKVQCSYCKEHITAENSSFQIIKNRKTNRDDFVCEKCIKELYKECKNCGHLNKKDDLKEVFYNNQDKFLVCDNCIQSYFSHCYSCKNIFYNEYIKSVEEKHFCRDCFNKNYCECTICQKTSLKEKMRYFIRAGTKWEKSCCDICYSQYGQIQEHDFRPQILSFRGKTPHYLGVELEVELKSERDLKIRGIIGNEVLSLMNGNAILKEDTSLIHGGLGGFEIVTIPANLEDHIENLWTNFFNNTPSCIMADESPRCALHVHCSRKPLSLLTLAKIMVFVNEDENRSFVETIAERPDNRYARIIQKKHGELHNMMSKRPKNPRDREYRRDSLNLTNKDTAEFRIFKGTLKKYHFFKSLEFCDALRSFCLLGNNGIRDCKNHKNFIDYVGLRAKDYPHLYAFICAKVLRKKTKLTEKFEFQVLTDKQIKEKEEKEKEMNKKIEDGNNVIGRIQERIRPIFGNFQIDQEEIIGDNDN